MNTKLNKNKFKLAIVSAMVVSSTGLSSVGYAATDDVAIDVTTTVMDSCTIAVTTNVLFGNYGTGSSNVDATGVISSTCVQGGSVTITLDRGDNDTAGSEALPARRMKDQFNADNAKTYLNYQLYSDSAGGTVWGNTAATGLTYTAAAGTDSKNIYGRIPSGQTVSAGAFVDEVLVTLTF